MDQITRWSNSLGSKTTQAKRLPRQKATRYTQQGRSNVGLLRYALIIDRPTRFDIQFLVIVEPWKAGTFWKRGFRIGWVSNTSKVALFIFKSLLEQFCQRRQGFVHFLSSSRWPMLLRRLVLDIWS